MKKFIKSKREVERFRNFQFLIASEPRVLTVLEIQKNFDMFRNQRFLTSRNRRCLAK